jgi:tetratricopeptide (TPR) repeat protein
MRARVAVVLASLAGSMLGSLLVIEVAIAQPDPADRAKAKDLTERAIEKVRANEYPSAIDLYQRAYELSGEAILLSNIGSAYQSLGKREKALTYFCRYLEKDPSGKLAGFAREQANELATSLGLYESCSSKSAPESAPVVPPSPTVAARDREPATDELHVTSEVAPASKDSGLGSPLRIGGIVIGAGGTVALGIGAYYGWVGKRASDVISNNKDRWTADEIAQQQVGKQANRRMATFLISGGAAVVTGTALYLWGRSLRHEEHRTALIPTVSGDASGLAVIGTFE